MSVSNIRSVSSASFSSDDDGFPDYLDFDSDGDGVADEIERGTNDGAFCCLLFVVCCLLRTKTIVESACGGILEYFRWTDLFFLLYFFFYFQI